MPGQTAVQVPLVLNTAGQLPVGGVERMRPDVIHQRGEHFAVIGEKRQTGMRRERRADLIAELAPAAQSAQRVVFGRQLQAECTRDLAAVEQQRGGDEMERDRCRDKPAPAALQRPADDEHSR